MRDGDALEKNPHVSRSALEAMHAQLYGWALSRCNYDPTAAEELMQQAYLELLTGNARFDNRSSLKTFVFAVVEKLARSRFRRLTSRLRLLRRYQRHAADVTVKIDIDTDAGRLWRAVGNLPARQRDIIELVFCHELTIEEASSVMGVTVGTGRAHYARAKRALKTVLQEPGGT